MPDEITSMLELPPSARALSRIRSAYRRFAYEVRHPENHKQLVRFLCVGASGYVVNLASFLILVHPLLGAGQARIRACGGDRVDEQLLLEPALDVPGQSRITRPSGRAILPRIVTRTSLCRGHLLRARGRRDLTAHSRPTASPGSSPRRSHSSFRSSGASRPDLRSCPPAAAAGGALRVPLRRAELGAWTGSRRRVASAAGNPPGQPAPISGPTGGAGAGAVDDEAARRLPSDWRPGARHGQEEPGRDRRAEEAPAPGRLRLHARSRRLAGELVHAAGAGRPQGSDRDAAAVRLRRRPATSRRSGRGIRSPGRWRAATPAPSAAASTRCTCGCRCASSSCCRSSPGADARRCGIWTC